ncbi:Pentatricopeptide repeat-containing protein [Striga hermonthica]|uniref:Pentatricopeptide repeat-containing protein n=1 Tax=Striga hermonthica TaxID=68872 RepID=A0A9N7MSN9_STRHE|nr:Pentatricopeptide repeat-containing protein [Striga hermonthica]
MATLTFPLFSCPVSNSHTLSRLSRAIVSASRPNSSKSRNHKRLQLHKNRRRTEAPPDFHPSLRKPSTERDCEENNDALVANSDDSEWDPDEIEAISSIFQGRVPPKPNRERPLPLPLPHKTRPLGFPTSKRIVSTRLSRPNRQLVSNQVYKKPNFLIGLARDIRALPPDDDVSSVLDRWARFLRKGSLSLTIRELGHMSLPKRALHVFTWVQRQPHLFPDDRVLASTVRVLAQAHELKMPINLDDNFVGLASKSVYEAMVKGFMEGGNWRNALRLLSAATRGKRILDPSLYAKLIMEIGKNPDKRMLVLPLLEELGRRDEFDLTQQDCTGIMKVCASLGKFDAVEALYGWFKKSGNVPSVVMYTTIVHCRYLDNKYKEAMAVVWEMEASDCLLDLPAYRVLIKLFVALGDLSRTARYFTKLKESGFAPTYDIYRCMIGIYMASGRLAKCKQICREAEMAGHNFNELQG